MGVRFPSVQAVALGVVYGGGAFNQLLVSVSGLILSQDSAVVIIVWSCRYASGATGPIGSYDIRRGTTGGSTLVSAAQAITEAGATAVVRTGLAIDTPGASGPLSYTLFQNITNAATGFTYTEATIAAFAL